MKTHTAIRSQVNPPPTVEFISKLGKTSAGERTRIWLEGQRLTNVGFVPGVKIAKRWTASGLYIDIVDEEDWANLHHAVRGRVSGKGDKPIIDIVGAMVKATFGRGTHVKVTYEPGLLTIKTVK